MAAHDEIRAHPLSWTYAPLRGRVWAKLLLAVLLPVLTAGIFFESESLAVTAAGILFLCIVVSPALVPTRYLLDDYGVRVRHLGRKSQHPWGDFRRVIVDRDVLVLSPFPKPTFLDSFRGVYLRFGRKQGEARERVFRFVLARMAARKEAEEEEPALERAEGKGPESGAREEG